MTSTNGQVCGQMSWTTTFASSPAPPNENIVASRISVSSSPSTLRRLNICASVKFSNQRVAERHCDIPASNWTGCSLKTQSFEPQTTGTDGRTMHWHVVHVFTAHVHDAKKQRHLHPFPLLRFLLPLALPLPLTFLVSLVRQVMEGTGR